MRSKHLRELVRHLTPSHVANMTNQNRPRWGTVAHNEKVKLRIDDLDAVIEAFPQYELWLWKGEVDLVNGQISPTICKGELPSP